MLFRIATIILAPVPQELVKRLFLKIAILMYHCSKQSRRAVLDNLSRVLPQTPNAGREDIAKGVFRNAALNYYDLIRSPSLKWRKEDLLLTGQENLSNAQGMGKGVIIATAHLGSINLFLKLMELHSYELLVLVEKLRHKATSDYSNAKRSAVGITTRTTSVEGLKHTLRQLRNRGWVLITCDRAVQGTGIKFPFMGEETIMPTGAIELALRTGAPIVPAFGVRMGTEKAKFFFDPPILLDGQSEDAFRHNGTSSVVKSMEGYIRRFPEQWVVFSPVWTGKQ